MAHGKKLIAVCESGTAHYTAPLIRLAEAETPCTAEAARADLLTMPEDWPWWSVPEAEQVKAEMAQDPRWNIWAAKVVCS